MRQKLKNTNFNFTILIYAIISYLFFLITGVFVIKSWYSAGLMLFAPTMLYSLFRIFSLPITKNVIILGIYSAIPFFVSIFLGINNHLAGWETTGLIPIAILLSFVFRDNQTTPLVTSLLSKKLIIISLAAAAAAIVAGIRSENLFNGLYLFVSLYSPGILIAALLVFINFVIETTVAKTIQNSFKLFITGGNIKRIILASPEFPKIPQLQLSDIVTAQGVKKGDFLKMVEILNASFHQADAQKFQSKQGFSVTLGGKKLTMAPLNLFAENKDFLKEGLNLPKDYTQKSFVAIAENNIVIGYYVIDRIDSSSNTAFLKAIQEKYKIPCIAITNNPSEFKDICETETSFEKIIQQESDLIITDKQLEKEIGITMSWGVGERKNSDIYLAEPYIINVIQLISIAKDLPKKLDFAIFASIIPFLIPLLASAYHIYLPEIGAVSVLMSITFALFLLMFRKRKISEI